MLSIRKLAQLVQKKIQTFFFLEKLDLTCVDWVKDLKQAILFRFVSMRNTSNNCGALNIRL